MKSCRSVRGHTPPAPALPHHQRWVESEPNPASRRPHLEGLQAHPEPSGQGDMPDIKLRRVLRSGSRHQDQVSGQDPSHLTLPQSSLHLHCEPVSLIQGQFRGPREFPGSTPSHILHSPSTSTAFQPWALHGQSRAAGPRGPCPSCCSSRSPVASGTRLQVLVINKPPGEETSPPNVTACSSSSHRVIPLVV